MFKKDSVKKTEHLEVQGMELVLSCLVWYRGSFLKETPFTAQALPGAQLLKNVAFSCPH